MIQMSIQIFLTGAFVSNPFNQPQRVDYLNIPVSSEQKLNAYVVNTPMLSHRESQNVSKALLKSPKNTVVETHNSEENGRLFLSITVLIIRLFRITLNVRVGVTV